MLFRVTFEKQVVLTSLLCASIAFTASCAVGSRRISSAGAQAAPVSTEEISNNVPRVDINSASSGELEKLPGIGRGLAERIVEHRRRYGSFRRPEHLIIVRGISERRYKMLRPFIKAE